MPASDRPHPLCYLLAAACLLAHAWHGLQMAWALGSGAWWVAAWVWRLWR